MLPPFTAAFVESADAKGRCWKMAGAGAPLLIPVPAALAEAWLYSCGGGCSFFTFFSHALDATAEGDGNLELEKYCSATMMRAPMKGMC